MNTTNTLAGTARPWPLYALCAVLLAVCLLVAWGWSRQAAAIDQLQADVAALKAAQPEEELLEDEPEPDHVPARPSAPRAALRPVVPSAVPAPQLPPSTAPPARWGTTDLDREIADFTRSLNQEPAQ
ncbi:MAG: hypothetical protein NDI93_06985 [Pseudomonas sp.]|nr:hypothetical protein [Pseudomonas sp.]